ncbi:MAG: peptidylprolyl isomerase, partial [Limisphaerales bacterium]
RLAFFILIIVAAAVLSQSRAATIATFHFHRVGSIEIELFDDKPITVSNFLKYASSGRYTNQIIHRWVPEFVIQGGGFAKIPSGTEDCSIEAIPVYGTIQNESKVGTFRSNAYGTIAMARAGTNVNSASSQWYINLTNNAGMPPNGLDYFAEGYTVFGRVISGTNIINLFHPPPPVNDIYITQANFGPMATLTNAANLTCDDLVTVNLSFRRDMNVEITRNIRGLRQIAWDSVAGVTNAVDYTTNLASPWLNYTNVVGTGERMSLPENSNDAQRFYRILLRY